MRVSLPFHSSSLKDNPELMRACCNFRRSVSIPVYCRIYPLPHLLSFYKNIFFLKMSLHKYIIVPSYIDNIRLQAHTGFETDVMQIESNINLT